MMAWGHEKESQDGDPMSKKTQGQRNFLESHKNNKTGGHRDFQTNWSEIIYTLIWQPVLSSYREVYHSIKMHHASAPVNVTG